MHEKYDDPIETLVRFKDGQVLPCVFRWQGRVYHIEKINMIHKERAGNDMVYYFSVSDKANFFRLAFFTRNLSWRMEEVFNN